MSSDTQPQPGYIHDYKSAHATNMVSVRTADVNGRFFLPNLRPGMTLLDCGCGPGAITVGFSPIVTPGDVLGVDIDEGQVSAASERAAQLGLANVRFKVGDIYELPFQDNLFDAAFAHTVFEHLSDPAKAAKEMLRVLKPGGVIGIRATDCDGVLFTPMNDTLEKTWDVYMKFRQYNGGNPFIGKHLKALLREVGFVNIFWTASYDHWSTAEQVKSFMVVHLVEMTGPRIVEQANQQEWVNQGHFQAAEVAIKEWGEHPDAIFAIAMGEAVGWKV